MIGAGEYAYPLERSPKGSEQIAVTELWFDGVDAPAGQVYYLLDVNASNSGVHDWLFDPSHLSLTSNTSDVYAPDPGYNETAILGASSIDPGRQILGEVAFGLPTGQSPSKLSYVDNAAGISLQQVRIPAVSAVASRFDPYLHYTLNGTSNWGIAISTWGAIANLTTPRYVFFTGEKILASFALYYHKRPADPMTVMVTSITNENGFPVSDVLYTPTELGSVVTGDQYPLPAPLTGYGANIVVTLILTVPPGQQYGPLRFAIRFSSG